MKHLEILMTKYSNDSIQFEFQINVQQFDGFHNSWNKKHQDTKHFKDL